MWLVECLTTALNYLQRSTTARVTTARACVVQAVQACVCLCCFNTQAVQACVCLCCFNTQPPLGSSSSMLFQYSEGKLTAGMLAEAQYSEGKLTVGFLSLPYLLFSSVTWLPVTSLSALLVRHLASCHFSICPCLSPGFPISLFLHFYRPCFAIMWFILRPRRPAKHTLRVVLPGRITQHGTFAGGVGATSRDSANRDRGLTGLRILIERSWFVLKKPLIA